MSISDAFCPFRTILYLPLMIVRAYSNTNHVILFEQEREKKKAAKGSTKSSTKGPPQPTLEDFVQSPERAMPLFLEKCVYFIELEGLDSEGIYRVPGNKVHVEQLTSKFKEGKGKGTRRGDGVT